MIPFTFAICTRACNLHSADEAGVERGGQEEVGLGGGAMIQVLVSQSEEHSWKQKETPGLPLVRLWWRAEPGLPPPKPRGETPCLGRQYPLGVRFSSIPVS